MPENVNSMYSLCPLDGRYNKIMSEICPHFSEYALVRNRVCVEVRWLLFLIDNIKNDLFNKIDKSKLQAISSIYEDFNEESFERVREIENTVKHDVKAVELFVAEKLQNIGLGSIKSFIHFGCTSEDINNISEALMIRDTFSNVWVQASEKLIDKLNAFSSKYKNIAMLAHTHGQPATPTTFGKELKVFVHRFKGVLTYMKVIKIKAKFNGATGNYNAVTIAYPDYNWPKISKEFIESFGLNFNPLTTQIESHDYIARFLDGIRHFNNILIDLDIDIWLYISKEYLKQIALPNEVGSSTMPHKVNPINFENSEANSEMSNAICSALSNKLTKSRLQRDLSDSSAKRNIGLCFGYSLQAIYETLRGLEKLVVNTDKINDELNSNWAVISEAIQTVLRKYGRDDAYNTLKQLTRGKSVTQSDIQSFISGLEFLSAHDRERLLNLTPEKYIGLANKL